MGQQTTLVETPAIFTITHFYFIDQTHGALVGSAQVVNPHFPHKMLCGLRWTTLAFAAVAGVAGPSARAIYRPLARMRRFYAAEWRADGFLQPGLAALPDIGP